MRTSGFDIDGAGGSLKAGTLIEIPGGATLEYCGSLIRKSFGIPEVLNFIIEASKDIDLALVAAWLYEKVKNKNVERITVQRRMVTEITEDRIRQTLEEVIRSGD